MRMHPGYPPTRDHIVGTTCASPSEQLVFWSNVRLGSVQHVNRRSSEDRESVCGVSSPKCQT
jgi:hypothetical protein